MAQAIDKGKLQVAIESVNEFSRWKADIKLANLEKKSLDTRMQFVMVAIEMGITAPTAIQLCYVNPEDFASWSQIAENREKLVRANARAEAQLEYIIHQYAMIVPEFALQVLTKRNSKRWDTTSVSAFESGMKAGRKLSSLLGKKEEDGENSFDVTA